MGLYLSKEDHVDYFQTDGSSGNCRMCLEGQISDDDPVVQLGCRCLGDNSCAHESCIRKWFPQRAVDTGLLECEICKTQLGNRARLIVAKDIRSRGIEYVIRRGLAQIGLAIQSMENQLVRWFFPALMTHRRAN